MYCALGVKVAGDASFIGRRRSVDGSSLVFVALSLDSFVARRRLSLVDARTTTLLYADEQ